MKFGLPTVLGAGAAGAWAMDKYKESGLAAFVPTSSWSSLLPSNLDTLPQQLKDALASLSSRINKDGGQVDALQAEMRSLSGSVGDLAARQGRPTVVRVGGGGRGWVLLLVPLALGGGVYAYCHVTGTSAWDLFFASKRSLEQVQAQVQEGMAKLWEEAQKHGEEVYKLVASLGSKQDGLSENQKGLRARQDQMDRTLQRVDDTTQQLDAKADHLGGRVEQMDTRLQAVHRGVEAANQGIHMLVSAVSEVTHRIAAQQTRAAQALHSYVTAPPSAGGDGKTGALSSAWGLVSWVAGGRAGGKAGGGAAGGGTGEEQQTSSQASSVVVVDPALVVEDVASGLVEGGGGGGAAAAEVEHPTDAVAATAAEPAAEAALA